jgi:hypothetical protein
MAHIICSYTAVKQEALLTRNSVSLIIRYARLQIADSFLKGIDPDKQLPWQYGVARMSKVPSEITGIECYHCRQWIHIGDQYLRKRSNHNTKIYCIDCAERLSLRG